VVILGNAFTIAMIGSLGKPSIDRLLARAEYYFSLFFFLEFLFQVAAWGLVCLVYECVCLCVCELACISTFKFMHVCVHTSMHVCVCMCVCVFVCKYS
jgi:hypothetical protein